MPKPTGPTIPRWQLGRQLRDLREAADVSVKDAADAIGRSDSQVRKFELGTLAPSKTELPALLDLYRIPASDDQHESLERLRQAGTRRGWWSRFGTLPWSYARLLGLEEGATTMRIWSPSMIPGLLQTKDTARALLQGLVPFADAEHVERQLRIRMERQEQTLGEDPPSLQVILDESVIHRAIGGPQVHRVQLERLLSESPRHRIQILPANRGAHPGLMGAFTILEFPEDVHSPLAYAETSAGGLYMEDADDLQRCSVAFDHMTAAALSPQESTELLAATAREL